MKHIYIFPLQLIKVEGALGSNIWDAITDAKCLAILIDCIVELSFNDRTLLITRTTNEDEAVRLYWEHVYEKKAQTNVFDAVQE